MIYVLLAKKKKKKNTWLLLNGPSTLTLNITVPSEKKNLICCRCLHTVRQFPSKCCTFRKHAALFPSFLLYDLISCLVLKHMPPGELTSLISLHWVNTGWQSHQCTDHFSSQHKRVGVGGWHENTDVFFTVSATGKNIFPPPYLRSCHGCVLIKTDVTLHLI